MKTYNDPELEFKVNVADVACYVATAFLVGIILGILLSPAHL